MDIKKSEKLIFIGDSITDAGRAHPQGEGFAGALGGGYVSLVDALIAVADPTLKVRVINKGTGGQTVRDLKARWQADVIDLKPDWLSIMIGINDVWRHFDLPLQTEIHVSLAEYESTLDEITGQAKAVVTGGLVVMTPFFIEANKVDAMRAQMDEYGAAAKRVAAKQGVRFVDTQAAFDRLMESYWPGTIAGDRVHPGPVGHMAIARAFLSAVNFTW